MKIGKLRISAVKNDSFVDPQFAKANVGESIQSVAMEYIYEKCGVNKDDIVKINQCDIKQYDGEDVILPLRLPLSRENVDDFLPLKPCVHPFFISLHLHDDIFEGRPDLINYFKLYEPIGCRDEISCSFFRKYNIHSFIMGCYTLAFPTRVSSNMQNKIYMVDTSKALEEYIPNDILQRAIKLSHAVPYKKYPVTPEEDLRLENLAREYIERYRDTASLLITSRLHVASPAIAMGIPVVLASDNADFRYAWIDAFLKLYQINDYSKISWNPSTVDINFVREKLFEVFDGIINHQMMKIDALSDLDLFYRNRKKTDYYQLFKTRLKNIGNLYGDTPFTYAIWGAGNHSSFAYDLMNQMYPNAKLVAVVDRFKKGVKFGVPIVNSEEILKFNPQHICISTKPGLNDALQGCKLLYGDNDINHYTIITSQQES